MTFCPCWSTSHSNQNAVHIQNIQRTYIANNYSAININIDTHSTLTPPPHTPTLHTSSPSTPTPPHPSPHTPSTPHTRTQIASGRLSYQHVGDGDQPPAAKKRRVGSARVERPRGVAAQFRQTDTTDVQEVGHN